MRRLKHQVTSGEDLFVGIDLHKNRWYVTIRTVDLELFSASIPGTWEALQRVLARYVGQQLQAVYEAGYYHSTPLFQPAGISKFFPAAPWQSPVSTDPRPFEKIFAS
jgi:hypothetical protein